MEVYLLMLMGGIVIIPIILLSLKDSLLKNRGLKQREAHLFGVKYLVGPFMILISILFIIGSWWIFKQSIEIDSFIIGAFLGSISGFLIMFNSLKTSKKIIRSRLVTTLPIAILFFALTMIIYQMSSAKVDLRNFLDQNPSFTAIFLGWASLFSLFTSLTHLIQAIRGRFTLI